MKRTLVILGIGCAATVLGASTAQAGEQHHKVRQPIVSGHKQSGHQHHPTCGGKCTPAPTPPEGGWPCQATHSCKPPKVPHCPKPHKPPTHQHPKPPHHPGHGNHHPPHKPPVTPPTHVTPKPPVHVPAKPATPTARVRVPVASATPQLAYTGATSDQLKVAGLGGGLLVGGTALVLLTSPLRAFNRKARVR